MKRFSPRKAMIFIIKIYQNGISAYTRPHCKYIPTCSNYAIEAVERFGIFRGMLLAVWRILRCNPFSRGGYDPVPDKFLNFRK